VKKPGIVSEAYRAFHGYSVGNQMLAMVQCYERGIEPGPINTYPGWQRLGRQVRRGEKALTLCMPVTGRRRKTKAAAEPDLRTFAVVDDTGAGEEQADEDDEDEYSRYTRFVYRPNWFVLAQTDGEEFKYPELPGWSKALALGKLQIKEASFQWPDGNTLGYASGREIAVSPLSPLPYKTLFHEIGHVELGHTDHGLTDGEHLTRSLREAEAESVALLCLETLGLEGTQYARGYIQSWLNGAEIPEKSARKIFAATDKILRAGHPKDGDQEIAVGVLTKEDGDQCQDENGDRRAAGLPESP